MFKKIKDNHIDILAGALIFILATAVLSSAAVQDSSLGINPAGRAHVRMFAPARGDSVGIGGKGWVVDLAVRFNAPLENTGFTGLQLTGPLFHNNVPPFRGRFAPGKDDRFEGLVVLVSTSTVGAGAGQNLANLFNLTGVANIEEGETEIWDTWIIAAPNFGVNTRSTILAAIVDDLNGDGIFNDAPDVVLDSDGDGDVDRLDLLRLGVASNIESTVFFINP